MNNRGSRLAAIAAVVLASAVFVAQPAGAVEPACPGTLVTLDPGKTPADVANVTCTGATTFTATSSNTAVAAVSVAASSGNTVVTVTAGISGRAVITVQDPAVPADTDTFQVAVSGPGDGVVSQVNGDTVSESLVMIQDQGFENVTVILTIFAALVAFGFALTVLAIGVRKALAKLKMLVRSA